MVEISYRVEFEVLVPEHVIQRIVRRSGRAAHRLSQDVENVVHVITADALSGRPSTTQILHVAQRILAERMGAPK